MVLLGRGAWCDSALSPMLSQNAVAGVDIEILRELADHLVFVPPRLMPGGASTKSRSRSIRRRRCATVWWMLHRLPRPPAQLCLGHGGMTFSSRFDNDQLGRCSLVAPTSPMSLKPMCSGHHAG